MADIFHDFLVQAPAGRVFAAISTPGGLDCWWTKTSAGEPKPDAEYELGFGPQYLWRARVSRCVNNSAFELEMTSTDADWTGTRADFQLEDKAGTTNVGFHHTGWPNPNEHWRISCYCRAMYLRWMARYVEHGECVPYEKRLDV